MSRSTTLLVAFAALTLFSTSLVSTVAEARDGCGRGFYYDGRRCVPQYDYDRGYYDRGYYDRGYRPYRRDPGVSVDVGPNLRLNFGDPGPRYYRCSYGEC
jgi:hypothetical protein